MQRYYSEARFSPRHSADPLECRHGLCARHGINCRKKIKDGEQVGHNQPCISVRQEPTWTDPRQSVSLIFCKEDFATDRRPNPKSRQAGSFTLKMLSLWILSSLDAMTLAKNRSGLKCSGSGKYRSSRSIDLKIIRIEKLCHKLQHTRHLE